MYKFKRYRQSGLAGFNQPVGLRMNSENRWVEKAQTIPWDAVEICITLLCKTAMPAKPLCMALNFLLIQKQYGYFDREGRTGHGKFVLPVLYRPVEIPDRGVICAGASCRVPQAAPR